MEPQTELARRQPWSLLKVQWLDVPIEKGADSANLTWQAFSETFGVCLWGVSDYVARRVDDRALLESLVTKVFVDNPEVLVSRDEDREKLRRLLTAADLLLEGEASPRLGRD